MALCELSDSHPAYLLTGAPIPLSTNDPDSTYLTKGNRAAELGYFDNYLINNESCVIVGVQATAARLSQESAAARDMIDCQCRALRAREIL